MGWTKKTYESAYNNYGSGKRDLVGVVTELKGSEKNYKKMYSWTKWGEKPFK